MCGPVGSGKTTLAKKIEEDFKFNIISGDPLRIMIKNEVLYFKDIDISLGSEKTRLIRGIVHDYRKEMCKALLSANQPVIYDANAVARSERSQIIKDSTKDIKNLRTLIIYMNTPEEVILERLNKRPEKHWLKQYLYYKKPNIELPDSTEAQEVIFYNVDDYEKLKNLLSTWLT